MNKPLFSDMFENGIGLNGAATLTTTIGGRTGFYGISGSYSTAEHVDLSDLITVSAQTSAVEINENSNPEVRGVGGRGDNATIHISRSQ